MFTINDWKPHGMGLSSKVIWQNEDLTKDIRLHHWHNQYKNDAISFLTGAIHCHAFNQESTILKGQVSNMEIQFDNYWGLPGMQPIENPCIFDENVWYAWEYIDKKPILVGEGYIHIVATKHYQAGDRYIMNANQFHYFALNKCEEAETIVHREHLTVGRSIVLTQKPIAPVNGRKDENI